MKILMYSHTFFPSVGGIETVSLSLANKFVDFGHDVSVFTSTESTNSDNKFKFPVIRKASFFDKVKGVWKSDIVYSNGASLSLFFFAFFLGKPFVWTHGGYQLLSIDGLGWVDGEKAPLSPIASFFFHKKRKGFIRALIGLIKLKIRRFAGKIVAANVAITEWVNIRQPLPRQIVIYNPFPIEFFKSANNSADIEYEFIYVGRLVSEKGVETLIRAFQKFLKNVSSRSKLAIVGDGNYREYLQSLVEDLSISSQVTFFGKKTGIHLIDIIERSQIAVVPSEWEEPMGGVALELLAAGKNIIVSKNGGLAECVGETGIVFENGNIDELYSAMVKIYKDPELRNFQLSLIPQQLEKFDEDTLAMEYQTLFYRILEGRKI